MERKKKQNNNTNRQWHLYASVSRTSQEIKNKFLRKSEQGENKEKKGTKKL